jgi:acyl-CoA reductase-like NAD-dependent aldehyde dehydrogenase
MSAFDLVHDHIARQLAPKPCQPAVAQATPLASADDIREAIEVLNDEADAHDAKGQRNHLARADQLRRVVALLRANLHRVGG